ncbi:MAG: N-6 DNA methylase [Candidatus Pacebacteria bacterium]|nr:N-6 DNA methylase [Candidatus Paceibacterota bacterium]
MTIQDLIKKYHSNRANYLKATYNETQLRSDFLDPLFELLGWDIKNVSCKPTNEREVLLEEALKANASENSKKPDYTFRLFSERKFFIEAKKPSVPIESNIDDAKQVRRYGFTAKLKISVLSNFEYLLIYDCSVNVEKDDSHNKALIKKYHYTEFEDKFNELQSLLGRDSVYTGKFDAEWKSIEEKLSLFSIDNLFLNQINKWRKQLGAEICKHEPKISEQLLNDYVQSYINRIIFLRVCEDRDLETYQTLFQFADKQNFKALLKKFDQADKKYNSGLFDQFLSEKIIGNISSVFWTIIKQLYYPESPYSFTVFSSDILGSIYEIFLSEKLTIKNGNIELVRKPENVDKDIITTPNYIIKSILNQTVVPFCDGKSDKEMLKSKLADIACGSGAFLLELFQLLSDTLVDFYLANDRTKLIQTNINTYKLPFDLKRELLLNCIFGTDKDYNAVEAAKFGLLLKLLEGEDNNSVSAKKPILPDLSSNIHFGNTLITQQDVKEKKAVSEINPFDFAKERYDVIVGNPPYMKSEDMKQFTPLELPIYKKKYTTAYKQFDKYFVFIERGLELLKDGGWFGYIVPSKFAKVGAGVKLRNLLQHKGYVHNIVSFGANQVFNSKTTYTCLLILRKKSSPSFSYTEIRNLTEWKVSEKNNIEYQTIKTNSLNKDVWVLVPPELKNAFDKINDQSVLLEDIVGREGIFNGIQTSANAIYIFQPTKEDKTYYHFEKKGESWKIEKAIAKPYFQTSSGEDNLNTYRPFKPNARVIYPYKATKKGIDLISLKEIKKNLPAAYKYLLHNKPVLDNPKRDIKPEPQTNDEWHRYGRHQSLDKCGLPEKIIVGVLSVGDKYAIDYYGTLISSGGTAGYCVVALPQDSDCSIYYIQALLNSKYLEWYSALLGEVFRGGYIARGTKVLKRLPIRKIDFDNKNNKVLHDKIVKVQKELIQKQGKIDQNHNNKRALTKLNREFESLKTDLCELLKKLFNLGNDDLLIPLIKEMYEAN